MLVIFYLGYPGKGRDTEAVCPKIAIMS